MSKRNVKQRAGRRRRRRIAERALWFLEDYAEVIQRGDTDEIFRSAASFAFHFGVDAGAMAELLAALVGRGAIGSDVLARWRDGGAERIRALGGVVIPDEIILVGLDGIRTIPMKGKLRRARSG